MTVLAIAVSLSTPTLSYLLWKNLNFSMMQFSLTSELTLYLHKNLSEKDSKHLAEKIRKQNGVENVHYISRQASLDEFRQWSGLRDSLNILEDNPLPAVIIVTPQKDLTEIKTLAESLSKFKGVQEVQLDSEKLEKLTALSGLAGHIVLFCVAVMLICVCLVIGNAIRADLYASQAKIAVLKLLGATDYFVLRFYLYTGLIYALLGGLLACGLSVSLLYYFNQLVQKITAIFAADFELQLFSLGEVAFLLISTALIGYIAAWCFASSTISQMEKQRNMI